MHVSTWSLYMYLPTSDPYAWEGLTSGISACRFIPCWTATMLDPTMLDRYLEPSRATCTPPAFAGRGRASRSARRHAARWCAVTIRAADSKLLTLTLRLYDECAPTRRKGGRHGSMFAAANLLKANGVTTCEIQRNAEQRAMRDSRGKPSMLK